MKLSRLNRIRAFEIARFAMQKSGGDFEKAKEIVRAESSKLGLDPVLMSLLIQLAIYFLQMWIDNRSLAVVDGVEFEIPSEYTQELDSEICEMYPEICEAGTL
jgi:hypothetical protein